MAENTTILVSCKAGIQWPPHLDLSLSACETNRLKHEDKGKLIKNVKFSILFWACVLFYFADKALFFFNIMPNDGYIMLNYPFPDLAILNFLLIIVYFSANIWGFKRPNKSLQHYIVI